MSGWSSKSTTDHAAEIRATLKKRHGLTGRDVSVRSDCYSMGSAIRIEIKNPTVSLPMVEAIAQPAERIDRDQYGDILSGGNRFVTVHYSHAALDVIGLRYVPAVETAAQALAKDRAAGSTSSLIPIAGTPFLLGSGTHGWGLSLWEDHHLQQSDSVDGIARAVGCLMVARGISPPVMPPVEVPHTYGCQAAAQLGHACCCPCTFTPSA